MLTRRVTPLYQSADNGNQVSTRRSCITQGRTADQILFNRKPASSVSLLASPTLQSSKFDVNRSSQDGYPLFVRAANFHLEEMVERLLASGTNIESVNNVTKRNASIEASMKGHTRIVEFLLDHRCSTECLDSNHKSALHHVSRKRYLLVAKALTPL